MQVNRVSLLPESVGVDATTTAVSICTHKQIDGLLSHDVSSHHDDGREQDDSSLLSKATKPSVFVHKFCIYRGSLKRICWSVYCQRARPKRISRARSVITLWRGMRERRTSWLSVNSWGLPFGASECMA